MDDSNFKNTVRRIVMSKSVADSWLKQASDPAHTLTIYFSDPYVMDDFSSKSRRKYGKRVEINEAFDRLTVISSDEECVEEIRKMAKKKGLELTDL